MRETILKSVIFFLLLTQPTFISEQTYINQFIIWNVGQGQWVTWARTDSCLHFDIGGEKKLWRRIKAQLIGVCQNKPNEVFFSHWDWDHINMARLARSTLLKFCQHSLPPGRPSKTKLRFLKKIRLCKKHSHPQVKELNFNPPKKPTSNELSKVYSFSDCCLLPGDSPINMEKRWIRRLPYANKIKFLILGHHGSLTSTSAKLLDKLPNLVTAISSARYKRYGHPHPLVQYRVKKNHVALLRTEDWGNIYFDFHSP